MTKSIPNDVLAQPLRRRQFLRTSAMAVGAVGFWSELPARASTSANARLKVLCVGTANRAASDIDGVASEEIVGLCDVDQNYLEKAHAKFPSAKTYRDYREMITAEASAADAIVIGTTDHHHAPCAIRAIRAGLHCYCEKPLTHTVHEARLIAQAAKEAGVATQMGTQIHAGSNYRRVVEIIQSGAIGEISHVHVWVGKGWGGGERPTKTEPAPAHLDWDLWLGPAPHREYAPGEYHPAQWRRWWDFGQGTLGDMGCHFMDLPFWALGLRYPTECSADGSPLHPETCATGLTVQYKFPVAGQSPITLSWYDGNRTPKEVEGIQVKGSGVMFVGSEGKMFADYGSYKLYPEEKFASFTPPPRTIPDSIGHHAEWIKACKDGSPTTCNFDYSGALTESVLLGNVAYRLGQSIQWDGENLRATDCPEADKFVKKQYRAGWEVEATA